MTESKKNTPNNWEDKNDVIPEMSDPYWLERFMKATLARGRPSRLEAPKVSTTIRFDAGILPCFRAGGGGWQSRINSALRQWLDLHGAEA